MKTEILLALISVPVIGGVVITRLRFKRLERGTIASRLARWAPQSNLSTGPLTLLKKTDRTPDEKRHFEFEIPGIDALKSLLLEAGMEDRSSLLITMSLGLLVLPLFMAAMLDWNLLLALAVGLVLAMIPIVVVKVKAEARRTKFCEQLPDAIDLIVAVLRSGHSVSQAVKAVGQEIAKPCGEEFEAILQRMNLGQPLSESLVFSARRFKSYELDLMRRAVGIQAEVGGSLAELLDKTNGTLRERLKMARQLKVITAQSRLSALIVGMLPVILAGALNFISPGYLQLLMNDNVGQILLCGAVVLEVVGVLVMRKMSTMRI
jgi:tight adherence protein B